jgi:DNA primase
LQQYERVTDWTLARIREYYRAHAELLAGQLIGRNVTGYPPSGLTLSISNEADILAHTEAGVGGFLTSPAVPGTGLIDRMLVTLSAGEGADIATAATAALALNELFARDGYHAVAAVDGQGGMMLLIRQQPGDPASARRYLDEVLSTYAATAPELATTDPELTDGRILLSAAATEPAVFSWAPYSLVPGAWPGVVMPLHDDDVAAASAGMPLEIEPEDVTDRLELRGDLLGQSL